MLKLSFPATVFVVLGIRIAKKIKCIVLNAICQSFVITVQCSPAFFHP